MEFISEGVVGCATLEAGRTGDLTNAGLIAVDAVDASGAECMAMDSDMFLFLKLDSIVVCDACVGEGPLGDRASRGFAGACDIVLETFVETTLDTVPVRLDTSVLVVLLLVAVIALGVVYIGALELVPAVAVPAMMSVAALPRTIFSEEMICCSVPPKSCSVMDRTRNFGFCCITVMLCWL